MSEKRPTYRILLLLMTLAGWLLSFPVNAAPLPLPPGLLDTNLFNTNGLTLSPDVQFLLHDLQTNLDQLRPFLAIINGENNTNASNHAVAPTPPTQPQPSSNANATNAVPLIYGLGAALENVQSDIQDLLPRLAAMVGQTNYSGTPITTNNATVPNRYDTNSAPRQMPRFQKIFSVQHSSNQFINRGGGANALAQSIHFAPVVSGEDIAARRPCHARARLFAKAHSSHPQLWKLDFGPWTTFPF